jgi:hypothetical protein
VIVSGGGEDLIAATQHVLPHYLRRHVCIAWLGEVAVRGAADEAAFALRIKPAGGFSIWNYRSDWCARSLLLLSSSSAATATASTAAWSVLRALSAASALIASATSIVAIVVAPLTGVALIAIALLLLTPFTAATTASFATRCLLIVRCLLLLLWRSATVTAAVGRAVGGGGGWSIGFGIRRRVGSGGGI